MCVWVKDSIRSTRLEYVFHRVEFYPLKCSLVYLDGVVERQSLHRPPLTKSRVRKHGLSLQERSGSACYALHHHMAVLAILRILWCRIDKSFKTSPWTVHPQAGQSSNVSDSHLRHKPSDHRPSFSCTTTSPLPPRVQPPAMANASTHTCTHCSTSELYTRPSVL